MNPVERAESAASAGLLRRVRTVGSLFALHDLIVLGYLFTVLLLVALSSTGRDPNPGARPVVACIVVLTVGCVVARGTSLPAWLRGAVYRLVIVGVLVSNYLMLREVLPIVRGDSLDEALRRVDGFIFGVDPVRWLERFNRPAVVEWFAFFYFSYFAVCFLLMAVVVWVLKPGRHTREFALGTVLVYCVGQLGYMLVPAYGPISYFASSFEGPVQGGFFWNLVWGTVQAGGAVKDVFPSLHTAVPTWFACFLVAQARRDRRYWLPAIVAAFFAVNIMGSTLVLRWHYAVDVIAGLVLGLGAARAARALASREERWRSRLGLPDPWHFGPPERAAAASGRDGRDRHPPEAPSGV